MNARLKLFWQASLALARSLARISMAVIGVIAWVRQYLPSWTKDTQRTVDAAPRVKILEFPRAVAQWDNKKTLWPTPCIVTYCPMVASFWKHCIVKAC